MLQSARGPLCDLHVMLMEAHATSEQPCLERPGLLQSPTSRAVERDNRFRNGEVDTDKTSRFHQGQWLDLSGCNARYWQRSLGTRTVNLIQLMQ